MYLLLLGEQSEGPQEREGFQERRGGRRQGAPRTQATVQGRNRYFATLMALKLHRQKQILSQLLGAQAAVQGRNKYCHIAGI